MLLQSLDDGRLVIDGRQHDDRQVAILVDAMGKFEAADAGHVQIDDGQVGQAIGFDARQGLLAGDSREGAEASFAQSKLHQAQGVGVIVDCQDALLSFGHSFVRS